MLWHAPIKQWVTLKCVCAWYLSPLCMLSTHLKRGWIKKISCHCARGNSYLTTKAFKLNKQIGKIFLFLSGYVSTTAASPLFWQKIWNIQIEFMNINIDDDSWRGILSWNRKHLRDGNEMQPQLSCSPLCVSTDKFWHSASAAFFNCLIAALHSWLNEGIPYIKMA